MNHNTFFQDLYKAVDSQNVEKLADSMTEDGVFRFANIPAVEGRQNISQFLAGFYQTIKSIQHSNIKSWHIDDNAFVTGEVTYTRPDDFKLKVPFSVHFKFNGDRIKEWLIFVDNSALYN